MSKYKDMKFTVEDIIAYKVAHAAHMWIYEKGDELNRYQNGIDRECDMRAEAIVPAIQAALKMCRDYPDRLKDSEIYIA